MYVCFKKLLPAFFVLIKSTPIGLPNRLDTMRSCVSVWYDKLSSSAAGKGQCGFNKLIDCLVFPWLKSVTEFWHKDLVSGFVTSPDDNAFVLITDKIIPVNNFMIFLYLANDKGNWAAMKRSGIADPCLPAC